MKDRKGLKIKSSDESNRILGESPRSCRNTTIVFTGKNNIVYLEKGVIFNNANIRFNGSNALLYIGKNKSRFNAQITLESDATCVFGQRIFMNSTDPLKITCGKGCSVIIGSDCLLSLAIVIDTATDEQDSAGECINKSILIGQHVWLGQNVTITGGSIIRSGAVIGSNSITDDKKAIPSFSCWAGRKNRIRKIHGHIVFLKDSIRNIPNDAASEYKKIDDDQMQHLLRVNKSNWKWVQEMLDGVTSAEERLSLLEESAAKRKFRKYHDPDDTDTDTEPEPATASQNNRVIGNYTDRDSRIIFRGSGNVLIVEDNVILENSLIAFNGDNSLIYLSSSDHPYRLSISMHTDTLLYMGNDNTFSAGSPLKASVAEARCVLVGNNCTFGSDIWLRTSDQHAMYDQYTRRRLNPPKSIIIGDDSEIKDHSLVLKGRRIGIKKSFFFKGLYERTLKKLESTTDIDERIDLLKEL